MSTRNLVPRDDNEGNIGSSLKNWLKGWFKSIFVSGNITDGANDVTVAELRNQLDNPSTPDADQIATDDSGETVQDKIDDADTHIADTNNPHSVDKADVGLTDVPDLDTTDAVNNEHVQGTDTELDNGGANPITAETIKGHVEDTENPHAVEADQVATTDSGETVQDKIDTLDIASHARLHDLSSESDHSDVVVSNVQVDDVLAWNGSKFVNKPGESITIGQNTGFFLDDTITIDDMQSLLKEPATETPEEEDSVAVTNETLQIERYLYNVALGGTQIDGGIWEFNFFTRVNSQVGDSRLIYVPYKVVAKTGTVTITGSGTSRTATANDATPFIEADAQADILDASYLQTPNGVFQITGYTSTSVVTIATDNGYVNETTEPYLIQYKLFELSSLEINSIPLSANSVTTVQPSFAINTTDKLVLAVFGTTDSVVEKTIYYSHNGTENYSHFHAPLVVRHNDLAGLNDGDYKHLTAAEKSAVDAHLVDTNNPHSVEADQIATVDSGETVQDKIDDTDAHIALTNNPHSVTKAQVGLTNVDDVQQMPLSYLDTDPTLAADSDEKVSSQKGVKQYIDALLGANDAMTYKGVIDCGGNPDYPAADTGDTYRISVAGKLGGASGEVVEVGDMAICLADSTASGDQATVGEFWNIIQVNIDGNIVGTSPYSSTDDNLAMFNGTSGKIIEDSGLALADVTGHIADTENPHDVEADQIATTDSGVDVQAALDTVESDITDLKHAGIPYIINGGGSEISTGIQGFIQVPDGFNGTITKVTAIADQSGSIVIDVWKDIYANYPPDNADSITASAPITISGSNKSEDSTLPGWTKSISGGDILYFNVDSVTTHTLVAIMLHITRT